MNFLERLVQRKNASQLTRIGLHLLFWLVYGLISYYFNTISLNIFSQTYLAWAEPLCNVVNLVLFYYPFIYFTWPSLFQKKKYLWGILILFIQLLLYTVLFEIQERWLIEGCSSCKEILLKMPADMQQSVEQPLLQGITGSFFTFGIVYILIARLSPVVAIKLLFDYIKERTAAIELEKENILLEFNFLKSQVNPHFLFNTMNNIHSLVIQDRNKDASATLTKLSDFLRHSLYESGAERISLAKEIKLLEDYIALEKLRLNHTTVSFDVIEVNPELQLPPLLFIPLVENAFKYTLDSPTSRSFINMSMTTHQNQLKVTITNNYDPTKVRKSGGIGLKNLRKRLQNYFPGKHHFEIDDNGNQFTVSISIDL